MTASRRALNWFLFGSVTKHLIAEAPCPVLVVLGSTHRGAVGRVVPGATVERLIGEAICAVVGTLPSVARRLHRSITGRVMEHASCPVLILPQGCQRAQTDLLERTLMLYSAQWPR